MIFYLKGRVEELSPTHVVIDVGGIGYFVSISLYTSQKLSLNKEIVLYIQQIIREDAHLLFGFFDKQEREMFNLLISVSGVGAVSAIILLSSLELSDISHAISTGDSAKLQKVKGIGAKTAERIIIDLRDKVQKFEVLGEGKLAQEDNKIKIEALSALEVLGITKKTSEKIANKILEKNRDISVEELIKEILKKI